MLDTQHTYYDFKNANYERIIYNLENIGDWYYAFNSRSTDRFAVFLQKTLLDSIHKWVPLRTFRNSTYPQWVSSSLKDIYTKKIQTHKLFKRLGGYT
jgi:hypothetical protein